MVTPRKKDALDTIQMPHKDDKMSIAMLLASDGVPSAIAANCTGVDPVKLNQILAGHRSAGSLKKIEASTKLLYPTLVRQSRLLLAAKLYMKMQDEGEDVSYKDFKELSVLLDKLEKPPKDYRPLPYTESDDEKPATVVKDGDGDAKNKGGRPKNVERISDDDKIELLMSDDDDEPQTNKYGLKV